MIQTVIAIVADCDDTLAPDTTFQLLAHFGIDPRAFFDGPVGALIRQGFDPAVAMMNEMVRLASDDGPLAGLTADALGDLGRRIECFPGIPEAFRNLEEDVQREYGDVGIRLEEYVISGGIADLITASPIGQVVEEIWGCNFAYDERGRICGIRNVVSFTEKTRFLFAIEKGLVGPKWKHEPYAVNSPMDEDERRIPIRNMIYLGDGPSDIPCMSVVLTRPRDQRGYVIGILNKHRPSRSWALAYGRRASLTVPPDFRKGEYAYAQLWEQIKRTADRIREESRPKASPGLGF